MLSGLEEASRDLYYAAKELAKDGFETEAIYCFHLSHLARFPEHVIAFESAKEFANTGRFSYAFTALCCSLASSPEHEGANRWIYAMLLLARMEQAESTSPMQATFPKIPIEALDIHFVESEWARQEGRFRFDELKRGFRMLAGRDCGLHPALFSELRFQVRQR